MARYAKETHQIGKGGFTVDGRVVDVLRYSPNHDRVSVLVEKPDTPFVVGDGAPLPEGVSDSGSVCGAPTEGDTACTREVAEDGDRCWQHV